MLFCVARDACLQKGELLHSTGVEPGAGAGAGAHTPFRIVYMRSVLMHVPDKGQLIHTLCKCLPSIQLSIALSV